MKKFNLSMKYETFERFSKVCVKQGEDPHKKLEKMIWEYVASSIEFDTKLLYQLKNDIDSDTVKIVNRENNFIILDNGNKIHVLDFEKLFEGIDPTVRNVLERLENMSSEIHTDIHTDYVDADEFLRKDDDILSNITSSIKNIDVKKCKFNSQGKPLKFTINDSIDIVHQYKENKIKIDSNNKMWVNEKANELNKEADELMEEITNQINSNESI